MSAFPGICPQPRVRGLSRRGLVAVLFLFASVAAAAPEGYIVPNFKDVDLTQIAEAVGTATGKNIVLDPRVHARVTMLSPTAISPAAFYQAFLSILQAYGFTAVLSGNSVIVLPSGGQ
jgi:general secretion pathway protein D